MQLEPWEPPAGPPERAGASVLPGTSAPPPGVAQTDPVARVRVLLDPPHLDRPFDYWVPAELSQRAQPGVRVRVRFAGRLVDGYLLERVQSSGHPGSLTPLRAVTDAIPVLTQPVADLVRAVARRYAGTFADVVRAAVPPRHRQAEMRVLAALSAPPLASRASTPGEVDAPGTEVAVPGPEVGAAALSPDVGLSPEWSVYTGAEAFFGAAARGRAARAAWVAGPGEQVAARVSELVADQVQRGRGAIIVVPDAGDVAGFGAKLRAVGVEFEQLTAAAGPQARYSAFMRVLTGQRRVVLGTRAAVFAPVVDLGLIVVWDDIDDSMCEPQAPGWHAREVAALRSGSSGCSLVIGGHSVSVETAHLVSRGWLGVMAMSRDRVRQVAAKVEVAGDPGSGSEHGARMPPAVIAAVRAALPLGPVLVSVRRTGYLPALSCQQCRERAVCPHCGAALVSLDSDTAAGSAVAGRCRQHGPAPGWSCPACGGRTLRAAVVGAARTVEEIGRAFPGASVVGSWAGSRVESLPAPQAGIGRLVVATPGCIPDPGPLGYQLAVILDGTAALSRPGLRTGELLLSQWLGMSALVRPSSSGGRVLLVGPGAAREVQAMVRWDPLGFALRELEERQRAGLPPGVRAVSLTGTAHAVAEAAAEVAAAFDRATGNATNGPAVLRMSGPIPVPAESPNSSPSNVWQGPGAVGGSVRWVVSAPLALGAELARAVGATQMTRSARKAPVVAHRMDPRSLL